MDCEDKPKRTDYKINPREIVNGDRCPVEVYELSKSLARWRAMSGFSRKMFD